MKFLFSLALTLGLCSLAPAQFRELPSTTKLRASRNATHVKGNLFKMLDFAVDGRVTAMSFSPKGDFLAVATNTTLALFNESGTRKLLIWDATKETPALFEDRPPPSAVLAFSADGTQLFFCGPQGLAVWNWPDGPSVEEDPVRSWTAPNVYNMAIADGGRVVCAAKNGSSHVVQLRLQDGTLVWEKESGLLPVTSIRCSSTSARCFTGSATGSECFWSDWNLADGHQSLPTDLGQVSAFSASQSPDGKTGAVVNRALSIINLETGEAKVTFAPYHASYYRYWSDYDYDYYGPYYRNHAPYDYSVDTGWTTLFSPDGNLIVTLGKEAVFYQKSTGVIVGRIYFSDDPFPIPGTTQAETDGIGCFSAYGQKFALVRQARVSYDVAFNEARQKSTVQRQVKGASGVEIYALG